MNEILWFLMLVVNFALITVAYRWWGKTGLYVWVAIAAIIANVQVIKTVSLFWMAATLGNIVYGHFFPRYRHPIGKSRKERSQEGRLRGILLSNICYGDNANCARLRAPPFRLFARTPFCGIWSPSPHRSCESCRILVFSAARRVGIRLLEEEVPRETAHLDKEQREYHDLAIDRYGRLHCHSLCGSLFDRCLVADILVHLYSKMGCCRSRYAIHLSRQKDERRREDQRSCSMSSSNGR